MLLLYAIKSTITTPTDAPSPPKSRIPTPNLYPSSNSAITSVPTLIPICRITTHPIMRFFKRIVGFLGLGNHEVNKDSEDEINPNSTDEDHSHLPRRGFSVPVQVLVDKPHQIGPVLVPCSADDGGVQGLQWYTRGLKIDEDGDVADEFLEEVFPETAENEVKTWSTFEVKLTAKPAKARNPCLSREGTVQHYVKYHGRLQLVG